MTTLSLEAKMDETLVILAEECAEVQQAVAKILRFGDDPKSVKQLQDEIGDVLAMITILGHQEVIDGDKILKRVPVKLRKLKKWSNINDLDDILENL